jgi:hypothetical protein
VLPNCTTPRRRSPGGYLQPARVTVASNLHADLDQHASLSLASQGTKLMILLRIALTQTCCSELWMLSCTLGTYMDTLNSPEGLCLVGRTRLSIAPGACEAEHVDGPFAADYFGLHSY